MSGKARVALFLAGVGLVLGAWWGGMQRSQLAPPPSSSLTVETTSTGEIQVHVAGWVMSPGVVTVREGAIAADVVEAAGGLRPGAVTEAVNLAAPVTDGQQVVIPGPDSPSAAVVAGDGIISLNQASAPDLETLPGVGPVLADRIVAYREQNGPFQTIEDLLLVPGIGEAKLASIRDLVRVP